MIDLHSHILPGLDDGSANLDTSLEMAVLAVESGVTTLVATPHYAAFGLQSRCRKDRILQAATDFQRELQRENIPLQILPGMEIFGTPEVRTLLNNGELMGLAGTRHPLIEFPFSHYASQATDLLDALCQDGWQPVIAHPERYIYIQEDPSLLNLWVQMGCLLQVNKGSLLGRFGPIEAALAHGLVQRGFAFAVASDAHSSSYRTTWMGQVQTLLAQDFSPRTAHALLTDNPRRLLTGGYIPLSEPDFF